MHQCGVALVRGGESFRLCTQRLDLLHRIPRRRHAPQQREKQLMLLRARKRQRGLPVDRCAAGCERVTELCQCAADCVVDPEYRIVGHDGDAPALQAAARFLKQRVPPSGAIGLVRSRENVECQFEIGGGPCQRSCDLNVFRRGGIVGTIAAADRYDAERRLVTVDSAKCRRHADRACNIAAELECAEAGGHGCARTAGRATGRAAEIPGIFGLSVDRVVAFPVGEIFRHVGFAKDNRAGRLQTGHRNGVRTCAMGRPLGMTVGRRHARQGRNIP